MKLIVNESDTAGNPFPRSSRKQHAGSILGSSLKGRRRWAFLRFLCGLDPKRAAGTSLAILIPPIGLPAAWRAYHENHVDLSAALWIAGAFLVGAYASRELVAHIPDSWFRLAFGLLMIFVAVRFMLNSDSETTNAAAGLTAAFLAWLGYLGIKVIGRRRPCAAHFERSTNRVGVARIILFEHEPAPERTVGFRFLDLSVERSADNVPERRGR